MTQDEIKKLKELLKLQLSSMHNQLQCLLALMAETKMTEIWIHSSKGNLKLKLDPNKPLREANPMITGIEAFAKPDPARISFKTNLFSMPMTVIVDEKLSPDKYCFETEMSKEQIEREFMCNWEVPTKPEIKK